MYNFFNKYNDFFKVLQLLRKLLFVLKKGAVPKVMSVALIEPFDRLRNHPSTGSGTTLRQVVSINSTTVMQTYWTAPYNIVAFPLMS